MHPRRLVGLVVVASALMAPQVAIGPAAADGQGSAQSHLVGRGDIVTSVLLQLGGPRRPSGSSTAPRCFWRTLNDAQLEFLIAAVASRRAEPVAQRLLDIISPYQISDGVTDATLQAQICDSIVVDFRTTDRLEPLDTPSLIGRQMITRLPEPDPVLSPPAGVRIPLREPVFVSVRGDDWRPILTMLSVGAVTAEVRATPVSLRVFSGEPTASLRSCAGSGVAFDPGDRRSVASQARDRAACTLRYSSLTAPADTAATALLPVHWLGTVTVIWSAEWRTNGGPWRSLGLIPRTRLIERATREVTTVLESQRGSGGGGR